MAEETLIGHANTVPQTVPGEQYGFALALEIIEHMEKADGILLIDQSRRILEPVGRLLLSTPNRWSMDAPGGYYWGEKLRGWDKWTAWDDSTRRSIRTRLPRIGGLVHGAWGA